MGVVCTRTADGEALRDRCDVERSALINTYYNSHHNKLTRMVDDCLEQHDQCLIVDCHSFPAQALPYELDKNWPDICIGTDTYHTSTVLKNQLSTAFKAHGYDVAIDSPFSGTIVPLKHYHKDQRVESVMIEVNRSLYATPSGFKRVQSDLSDVIAQAFTIDPFHNIGE